MTLLTSTKAGSKQDPAFVRMSYGTQEQVAWSNFNPLRLQTGCDKLQLLPDGGCADCKGFEVGLA